MSVKAITSHEGHTKKTEITPVPPRSHESGAYNVSWLWTHPVLRSVDHQSRQRTGGLSSSRDAKWLPSVEGKPGFRRGKAVGRRTRQSRSVASEKTQWWKMASDWRLHQRAGILSPSHVHPCDGCFSSNLTRFFQRCGTKESFDFK